MAISAPTRTALVNLVRGFDSQLTTLGSQEQEFYGWVSAQSLNYLMNGLASVSVVQGGQNYNDQQTTVTVAAPTGTPNTPAQLTALLTVAYGLSSVAPSAGGSGYNAADELDLTQSGASGGTVKVTSVNGSGAVQAVTLVSPGQNYLTGTNIPSTYHAGSSGIGTGATFNITGLGIASVAFQTVGGLLQTGSGYGSTQPPTVSIMDASNQGSGAQIVCTLANTDNPLNFLMADAQLLQQIAQDLQNHWLITNGQEESEAGVLSLGLNAAGAGYSNGDTLTLVQTGGEGCTFTISTVTGSNAIQNITAIITPGHGYTTATGLSATPQSGLGSGATFNVTGTMGVIAPGIGYDFLTNLDTGAGLNL